MTKNEADEIISSFGEPLASYIKWRGLSEETLGMSYLKGGLLILVDQGLRGITPDPVLIAVAGAISYATLDGLPRKSGESGKRIDEAIQDSAEWLVSRGEYSSISGAENVIKGLFRVLNRR